MKRGFTHLHDLDMTMKFRFVDRGGRYVYEVRAADTEKIMGVMRVDWEYGDVLPDLVLVPKKEEVNIAGPSLTEMMERGGLDLQGGCMHSWIKDYDKQALVCQRCEEVKPL